MRTFLIVNKNAGSYAKAKALLSACADRADVSVWEGDSKEEAYNAARKAVIDGFDTIVAAGGDGTVHAVVDALHNHLAHIRLGIVPLGTGNDLSRSLGIPTNPIEALELATSQFETRIDLIDVRAGSLSDICVNAATGGFGGEVEEQVTEELKEKWGALAYLRSAASIASHPTAYQLQVSFDGAPAIHFSAINVTVANGQMVGGGFQVAPSADLTDGLLDVVIVQETSLIDLAAVAARLVRGDYTTSDAVFYRQARSIEITADPPMWVSVDGTLFAHPPIRFRVIPRALRLAADPAALHTDKAAA